MSEHDRYLCETCLQEEYDSFSHHLVHESMAKNDVWTERYRINDWPRWDYSLDDATLTFSEAGKAKVICDIQAVGSVQGDSWEWAWGNANLPESCRNRMNEVREFGEEKGYEQITTLFLNNDEYLGWKLASIAVHLLGGEAVYRCPESKTPGHFMFLAVLRSRLVQ